MFWMRISLTLPTEGILLCVYSLPRFPNRTYMAAPRILLSEIFVTTMRSMLPPSTTINSIPHNRVSYTIQLLTSTSWNLPADAVPILMPEALVLMMQLLIVTLWQPRSFEKLFKTIPSSPLKIWQLDNWTFRESTILQPSVFLPGVSA